MKAFLIALQFLTVCPIQLKFTPQPKQNAQSLLFYPVIGLLIGLILVAIAVILSNLPIILLSCIILVVWIWLTGGLHLDGLADTADAWVGGFGNADRTLSIMKDPSCGPIGVLSLIIVCMMKWAAIYTLLQLGQVKALILIPILGRLAPLFLFLSTTYVRNQGLGSSIAELIPRNAAKVVLVGSGFFSICFGISGLVAACSVLIVFFYLRSKFIQRIGGITGDTIGASVEISETLALLSFVIWMYC